VAPCHPHPAAPLLVGVGAGGAVAVNAIDPLRWLICALPSWCLLSYLLPTQIALGLGTCMHLTPNGQRRLLNNNCPFLAMGSADPCAAHTKPALRCALVLLLLPFQCR
jgi:hypothetical protein